MKYVVGTNTIGYPEIKNFSGLPLSNYTFQKKQNLFKLPAHFYYKFTGRLHLYYWNSYCDFNYHKVTLYHFFNALSFGVIPWLTTFETSLPRWGWDEAAAKRWEKGLSLIAGKSCKRIIAMSKCAANIQRDFVLNNYPDYADDVFGKMIVQPPAQQRYVSDVSEKKRSSVLTFILVGADFYRKGGKEILIAFDQLAQRGIEEWKLIVVSNMQYGDYASQADFKDVETARVLMDKYSNHIQYYPHLPNNQVIELLKSADVGLLPSYAETYGYSVLEAQAAGCPVVTTDVRAFPEINNEQIGWVIPVDKDNLGNAMLSTTRARKRFSENLVENLVPILELILDNRGMVRAKGAKALQKIDSVHSMTKGIDYLSDLYDAIRLGKI